MKVEVEQVLDEEVLDDDAIVVLLVGRDGKPYDLNKKYRATNPFIHEEK